MFDSEHYKTLENGDANSALDLMKSVQAYIIQRNYNMALSSLATVHIMLASAEANSRVAKAVRESEGKA